MRHQRKNRLGSFVGQSIVWSLKIRTLERNETPKKIYYMILLKKFKNKQS